MYNLIPLTQTTAPEVQTQTTVGADNCGCKKAATDTDHFAGCIRRTKTIQIMNIVAIGLFILWMLRLLRRG